MVVVPREMIHTASLLHDDVIDVADTRRGVRSVNFVFGNKLAILAGDFLLARASVSLARLRNLDVRVLVWYKRSVEVHVLPCAQFRVQ